MAERALLGELWRRQRPSWIWLGPTILAGLGFSWAARWMGRGQDAAESCAYGVLVVTLFTAFGAFHGTEGRRRGGFGSFPTRWFHLPVSTWKLVGVPMLAGVLEVVAAYGVLSWALLGPLGRTPPRLWPSFYLASGLSLYQAVVWSLPGSRYRKLILLSVTAAGVAFAWMFFLPSMIEGTLSDWGYRGQPASFQAGLLTVLAASVPAAYGLSWWSVRRQRHGLRSWLPAARLRWRRGIFSGSRRIAPYGSRGAALFWNEWRQTGLLLPAGVAVIVGLTAVLAVIGGQWGQAGTIGVLIWLFVAPVLLATVFGLGFCRVDFWRESLALSPFYAVRPFCAGEWVAAKLMVAGTSVVLAWGLSLIGSVWILLWAGDFQVLSARWTAMRLSYSWSEASLIAGLIVVAGVLTSWRMLVVDLWAGLSGHRLWYRLVCGITAAGLVGLLVWLLGLSRVEGEDSRLAGVWWWITWLPVPLVGGVAAKAVLGGWAWFRVIAGRHGTGVLVGRYLVAWLAGTALLMALPAVAFPQAPWLRHLLMLVSLGYLPLARPALGILALARNRASGGGA